MRKRITKRVVDTTAPAEKDSFVWDSDLTGFGLKVTPNGRKAYVLQYRLPGSPVSRRYTIGKHGSPWTPEEARARGDWLALRSLRSAVDPDGPAPR
jgi:hypothetical protein